MHPTGMHSCYLNVYIVTEISFAIYTTRLEFFYKLDEIGNNASTGIRGLTT